VSEPVQPPEGSETADGIRLSGTGRFVTGADGVIRVVPVETPWWRPRVGTCPYCGAPDDRWCAPDCLTFDPMDYR
jgi:hypothetical protein